MNDHGKVSEVTRLRELVGEKFDDLCALVADLNEKLENFDAEEEEEEE